jgi:hypothetical protein
VAVGKVGGDPFRRLKLDPMPLMIVDGEREHGIAGSRAKPAQTIESSPPDSRTIADLFRSLLIPGAI